MGWLQDFLDEVPDNKHQRTRQNLGMKPLTRWEGLRNLLLIIVLAFLVVGVVVVLGVLGII